jgi:putative sigma-54 modulation protein
MRLELTGRHVDITPALRRLVDRKVERLERLLNDSALSAQVVLTREKHSRRVDVTLHARGEKFLHGEGRSPNWEASLHRAIDKIAQQAHKVKGKWETRKRRATSRRGPGEPREAGERRSGEPIAARAAGHEAPGGKTADRESPRPRMPQVLRVARQPIKPMSVADAAREIAANGDGVVVFRDVETSVIAVLFRRRNGELTLVETESR